MSNRPRDTQKDVKFIVDNSELEIRFHLHLQGQQFVVAAEQQFRLVSEARRPIHRGDLRDKTFK